MSFAGDWAEILSHERDELRQNRAADWRGFFAWHLRVYFYTDDPGLGADVLHKDQNCSNSAYKPRIDGFFPAFKSQLKNRLQEIYDLRSSGQEEEAEDLLVAIPQLLKSLEDVDC